MKQEISVTLSKTDVPIGAALVCNFAKLRINWGEKTQLPLNSLVTLTSSSAISRHVARMYPSLDLYPSDILHRTESPEWQDMVAKKSCPPHILRWYNDIRSKVDSILNSLPPEVQSAITVNIPANGDAPIKREEEGKYVDLPGAKMGEVVVRFPPEASGYLHIGHAKAALLNQYYQKAFKGKLVMRFDDTNPDKEKADFEKEIIHDVKLLEVEPDKFSFTSDYFDQMLEMCESLLKNGKAYVDDTDAETMKKEREERKESKNRNNSVEQNLKMWKEMKCGSEFGSEVLCQSKN
ncbi:Bifunctional glutamate/proline--tRNA ligase [Armadillidium nasatum]|uniref:Bifunctional glutamate/proline--tRNA ligase n=1 Tax=Armadillidium nasatum TaxID=96803 RepID=A0A5N5SSF2_9CRUS|nr:Bifunctional glutamate/proline--tRNA ligase [Armadillidium nasatum]